jgi:drug/metabolite transporter (DMT)-like permease
VAGRWATALLGILAFSWSAALFKLSGASPGVGSTLRFAYATPAIALVAWRARGWRPGRALVPSVLAGIVVGVELVIWNVATERIGVGPSTVVVNTASLWVILLGALVLRRRPAARAIAGALVLLAGLTLLRGVGAGRLEVVGLLLGVLAAALYGTYILLFDVAVTRAPHRIAPVLVSTAVAAPVSLVIAIFRGESFHLTLHQHAWLALLGVGVQAGGWLLMARSLRWFSAVAISLLLLLQPMLAAIWGTAFLGESLGGVQVVGIGVVLVGLVVARPRPIRYDT